MAPTATPQPLLALEDIPRLQDEVRALARERNAVILAHNYQLPEVQDVADYVGDSLGLSRQAAATSAGVDPLARQDRPDPRPGRGLLARRLDHRRATARLAGEAPRRDHRHVRQHDRRDQGADRLLRDVG